MQCEQIQLFGRQCLPLEKEGEERQRQEQLSRLGKLLWRGGLEREEIGKILNEFIGNINKDGPIIYPAIGKCWLWTGSLHGKPPHWNYGSMWIAGKKYKSHRLSYCIHTEVIFNPKQQVCHRCDNPPCCNPSHLFIGSAKDNIHDCMAKGRYNKEIGSDRYNAVLTEADIISIMDRYTFRGGKDSGIALAAEFGVGRTMISAIVNRKRWKHVK